MQLFQLGLALLAGYIAGVLVNFSSDILPAKQKIFHPVCLHCGSGFPWFSYLTWDKCPVCSARRGIRHWFVVIAFILIAGFLFIYPHDRLGYVPSLILWIYLGIVFVIDYEHKLILFSTSYAGMLICGVIGIFMHGLSATLLGGAVGFAVMLALYFFGNWFGNWLARRKGIPSEEGTALGFGDVMLACVLGLLLGWPGITAGIFLAIILAGLFSLGYMLVMLLRKSFKAMTAIPYAPFLVISAVVLLFFL